jgi:hypothetical protein
MTKKIVKTTREELDGEETKENLDDGQELTDSELQLAEYLDSLENTANKIKVQRLNDGVWQFCDTLDLGAVSEKLIAQKFGGGQYRLIPTLNGRYVKGGTREISIYKPPEDLIKPVEKVGETEISLLKDQLNRQQELLIEMLHGAQNRPQEPMSLKDVVEVVKMLNEGTKGPSMMDIMEVIKTGLNIVQETAGGGDTKMEWVKVISAIAEKIGPIFPALGAAAMGKLRQAGTPAPEAAERQEQIRVIIARAFDYLKKKCLKGRDPLDVAEMVLDNMDDDEYKPLAMLILQHPFDELIKADPEIEKEPFKSWFLTLYNELRSGVFNANDEGPIIAGEGGDNPDAADHEASDGPGSPESDGQESGA